MLISAIEQALAGGAEMSPTIARQIKAHFDAVTWKRSGSAADEDNPLHPDQLERQVLQWTCDGFLPHEIARDLRISTREVAQRVRTLYRKLQLDRRTSSLSLKLL
jgi:DNA-binding NarL/FixJ family response regulator